MRFNVDVVGTVLDAIIIELNDVVTPAESQLPPAFFNDNVVD